ncbi:ABC transporter substrate-binding protein [Microbacterium indicum]|uniref:ABC transporter substrate-binding protein n=1 Tax=Microbacterium indicum TaxID=358100 RepID=UPI00041BB24E|nr:ABC transporter substrate-binding protein [Microbacterium indicum]
MTSTPARILAVGTALAGALGLAACGAEAPASEPVPTAAHAAEWPRTVDVEGASVEISEAPQRVVALSTETGDVALQLGGPDRLVAVSTGSVTEGAGNRIDLAEQVGTVLETSTSPDPEQILALEPDLVLMTARHDGEQDAASLLEGTGVPTIAFDSAEFQTLDGIADAVTVLGDALGEEDAAARVLADFDERRAAVEQAAPSGGDGPSVLLLMARGGQQMIQPQTTLMSHLVEQAGGRVVGAGPGAVPADPEQIVAAAPDVILVEDFRGAGLAPFDGLLRSAALAGVPAVADGDVHLVSGATASDTAATAAIDGLEEISGILNP